MGHSYQIPQSVGEALEILARFDGRARIIAGGTDLMPELYEGKRAVDCLVDVTRIPGLDRIESDGPWILVGAGVTFRQIRESSLVRERARVLAEAAASVGALPIQTVATLAGNVISALPAADGCVALVALDAQARVEDDEGGRWQPIGELFLGPGCSSLDPTRQMLTHVRFPALGQLEGSAWERIGRRQSLVLPIVNCAVVAILDPGGEHFHGAHIGLGPVAPVPYRARQAEVFLQERTIDRENLIEAGKIAAAESNPRTNPRRASREYRLAVIEVLVRRGLERAVAQACGES